MDITKFSTEEEYLSQMHAGALLNPRIDSTFKALFTQPTQDSREALHAFLEAATERKIKSFELTATDAPVEFGGQRNVNYDIACIFDDGLSAEIEMQAFNQKYDYGKRAEYQVARLETTYLKKGETWEKAPTVYQISILDFNYAPKSSSEKNDANIKKTESECSPVSRYSMRTKDGKELSNSLNIVFVELPKVQQLEQSLETNTSLENWAIFLKEADDPEKTSVIQKLTQKEAGLMQAKNSLSSISVNQDLWIAQYHQELKERDYISGLAAAKIEGIGIGRAEGILDTKIETARNYLKLGLTAEQVAVGSGLPLEKVRKIAATLII